MSHASQTPQTAYPLFSKCPWRSQYNNHYIREKRCGYNFEKSKDYTLAEKWFRERKERNQERIIDTPTPAPVPATTPVPAPVKPIRAATKGPPPGLTPQRPHQDICDLDLTIPSYKDFIYPEEQESIY